MVDVAVQGLVHSEHELSHTPFLSSRGTSVRFCQAFGSGFALLLPDTRIQEL